MKKLNHSYVIFCVMNALRWSPKASHARTCSSHLCDERWHVASKDIHIVCVIKWTIKCTPILFLLLLLRFFFSFFSFDRISLRWHWNNGVVFGLAVRLCVRFLSVYHFSVIAIRGRRLSMIIYFVQLRCHIHINCIHNIETCRNKSVDALLLDCF